MLSSAYWWQLSHLPLPPEGRLLAGVRKPPHTAQTAKCSRMERKSLTLKLVWDLNGCTVACICSAGASELEGPLGKGCTVGP